MISGRYQPPTVYGFLGLGGGKFGPRHVLLEGPEGDAGAMATSNLFDFDGDGDQDLLIGDVKGYVSLSLNEGSRSKPEFKTRNRLKVSESDLKVVQKSDPWPVDWDGDGLLDLLVGDENGDVSWFRGRKDSTFEQGVSALTGLAVDPSMKYSDCKERYDAHGRVVPGYRLRVSTHDWNQDGKLDLVLGNCESGEQGTTGHVYVLLRK